jgi:hypothetical protein
VNEEGRNSTIRPHPLHKWFEDWKSSLDAKRGLKWRHYDHPNAQMAHPNTKNLARTLHKYWLDQHIKQFLGGAEDTAKAQDDGGVLKLLNPEMSKPIEFPPYEEPEDENLFRELVVIHARLLHTFGLTEGLILGMSKRYAKLDWTA